MYLKLYICILETKVNNKLRENFFRENFLPYSILKKRIIQLSSELPDAA